MLDNALERESQSTGTVIWIVSTEGEIGIIKGNQAVVREIVQKLTDDTGKIKLQNPAQYKDVMSGSVPMVKEIGDFYGLFKDTNVSWLTIGKPFTYNGKILGLFTFIRRFRGTEGKKQCF